MTIERIEKILKNIELTISSMFVLISCIIVIYAIIKRNLGFSTGEWVLELPIVLLAYVTFFGCGANIAMDSHIKTELILKKFGEKTRNIIYILNYLLLISVFILIFYYSIHVLKTYYYSNYKIEELFYTPFYLIFLILPISLILWTLHYIIKIIKIVYILIHKKIEK